MIKWEDGFSVGISRIDEEHKKFIDLINRVVHAKEHKDDPEEIKGVLERMKSYALAHFKTEETYMEEFDYPEYQKHKAEHNSLYIVLHYFY
jgi:hemerythrin